MKNKSKESFPLRLICVMASLAGLMHDIGKTNKAFQDMIRSSTGSDRELFRHEFLSYMMLSWLSLESDWVSALSSSLEDGTFFEKAVQSVADETALLLNPGAKMRGMSCNAFRDKPALFSLLWLVVSHHRLPSGEPSNIRPSFTSDNYIRSFDVSNPLIEFEHKGMPWQDHAWKTAVVSDLSRLKPLLIDRRWRSEKAWIFDHVRLLARPALQFGDHEVSSQKTPTRHPDPEVSYANTVKDFAGLSHLGQELAPHLVAVGRASEAAVHNLLSLREKLPSIAKSDIPHRLTSGSSRAEFAWQDEGVQTLLGCPSNPSSGGFMGFLLAGTGSGKTRGAMKLIASLGDSMRVLYASPLRSLTLQAGEAFKADLGFIASDLSTIIGDPVIQMLFAAEKEPASSGFDVTGGRNPRDIAKISPLLKPFGDSDLRMIGTPVLSATLDTVMRLSDSRRGGYLSHLARVASSDLIIDEVDLYTEADQIAIGRLIESAGFWRSRVILSSATLAPSIASAHFQAYRRGTLRRDSLDGESRSLHAAWFSDLVASRVTKIVQGKFEWQHDRFAKKVAHQANKKGKRKICRYISGLDEVNPKEGEVDFSGEKFLANAYALHKANSIKMSGERHFSVGCIQVVTVKDCQRIALELCDLAKLANEHDDYDFRVVPLHGKQSLATRGFIDKNLNAILDRRGPSGDLRPLSNPFVQQFSEQSSHRSLMVIVVTTVETTGRDHDFDWGIIESRRERDIVQFAGRIRRHRPGLPGEPKNLIVCETPMSWNGRMQDRISATNTYSWFGVGNKIGGENSSIRSPRMTCRNFMPKFGYLPTYSAMMKLTYGDEKPYITPGRILTDRVPMPAEVARDGSAYSVRAAECIRLHNALIGSTTSGFETLSEWGSNDNAINRMLSYHADIYKWRDSEMNGTFWWSMNPDGGKDWRYCVNSSNLSESVPVTGIESASFYEDALLFVFDESSASVNWVIPRNFDKDNVQAKLVGVGHSKMPSSHKFNASYHNMVGLIDL